MLPRLPYFAILKAALLPVVIALALHMATHYVLIFMAHAGAQLLGDALHIGGRWTWLNVQKGSLLFWVLMYCVPVSILAALPIRTTWAGTLRKVVQAGLALYGLILCAGIAYVLVGAILAGVDQFSNSPGAEALSDLLPR